MVEDEPLGGSCDAPEAAGLGVIWVTPTGDSSVHGDQLLIM